MLALHVVTEGGLGGEALGTSTTAGLSFLANVQGNRSISGVRELSAMAPPREQNRPAPTEHEA